MSAAKTHLKMPITNKVCKQTRSDTMAKPNPQYPHGHGSEKDRDRSEFEEAKERLQNEKQEDRNTPQSKKQ